MKGNALWGFSLGSHLPHLLALETAVVVSAESLRAVLVQGHLGRLAGQGHDLEVTGALLLA